MFTFNDGIDKALGCDELSVNGGFAPGTITELAGQAGSGKTQFCLHLCAAVQLPAVIGNTSGVNNSNKKILKLLLNTFQTLA